MADVHNGLLLEPEPYVVGRAQILIENDTKTCYLRQEFNELPLATEVCEQIKEKVEAEQRVDYDVTGYDLDGGLQPDGSQAPQRDLAVGMNCDGQIHFDEKEELWWLSRFSLSQLSTRICPPRSKPASYLASCWPSLRSVNINAWSEEFFHKGKFSTVKIRTRDRGEEKEIWAILSSRYHPVDIDKIMEQLPQHLTQGSRAEASYDGHNLSMTIVLPQVIRPPLQEARELFRPAVVVTTADDGTAKLSIKTGMWSEGALGTIIMGDRELELYGGRHTASLTLDGLSKGMGQIDVVVALFIKTWQAATKQVVFTEPNTQAFFEKLVNGKVVYIPNIHKDVLIEKLVEANKLMVDEEVRYTKAGAVLSILNLPSSMQLGILEENMLFLQAGKLLFRKFGEVR